MPKLNQTLVVRPNSDSALTLCSYWIKKTIDEIAGALSIIDLHDETGCTKCSAINILNVLNTKDPIYFWGNGHGNFCVYTTCASSSEVFLSNKGAHYLCTADKNLDSMKGRVCHLLSCVTAKELGTHLVNHGAKAYIGYFEPFTCGLYADPTPQSKYTQSFLEPDCEIPLKLSEGETVKEAVEFSQKKSDEWIEYWRTSSDPEASDMIVYLLHNKDIQRLYGDKKAVITKKRIIASSGTIVVDLVKGNQLKWKSAVPCWQHQNWYKPTSTDIGNGAIWIWSSYWVTQEEVEKGAIRIFEKKFDLKGTGTILSATLKIAVDNISIVIVNGTVVAQVKGFANLSKINIKPYLQKDSVNELKFIVVNSGGPAHLPSAPEYNPAGIIYKLVMTTEK
jgi:hypothetical protein